MNNSGQCSTIFLKCQLSWVDKAVKELSVSGTIWSLLLKGMHNVIVQFICPQIWSQNILFGGSYFIWEGMPSIMVVLWIVIWPHYITSQWVSAASCLYCLVLKSYSYGMGSRRIWNSGKSQKRFFAGNYLFWPGILFELSNVRLCHHITVSFCCQLSVLPCIVLPSSTLFGVTVT